MKLKKLIALVCALVVVTATGLTACKEDSLSITDSSSSQSDLNSSSATTTTTTTTGSNIISETLITAATGNDTTTTQTDDSTVTTTTEPTTTTTTTTAKPVTDDPIEYRESIICRLDDDMVSVFEVAIEGIEELENEISLPGDTLKEEDVNQFATLLRITLPESDLIPYSYSYSVDSDGYVTKLIIKEYNKSKPQYESEKAAVQEKVKELVDIANSSYATQFEKALFFHDYIINNCVYESAENAHSAYGCLIDGKAVCEGYAKAFNLLCSEAGIEAIGIGGMAFTKLGTESHMWSKVCLDGVWTNIDITWDDNNGANANCAIYNYFGLTDSEIAYDHTPDSSSLMSIPKATSDSVNYFVKTGSMISSSEQADDIITNTLYSVAGRGEMVFTIRCEDSDTYAYALSLIKGDEDAYEPFFAKLRQAKIDVNPRIDATSILPITHVNSEQIYVVSIFIKYEHQGSPR